MECVAGRAARSLAASGVYTFVQLATISTRGGIWGTAYTDAGQTLTFMMFHIENRQTIP